MIRAGLVLLAGCSAPTSDAAWPSGVSVFAFQQGADVAGAYPDVAVAVIDGAGERAEAHTDADGRAWFPFDAALGPIAVVATDGRQAQGWGGLDATELARLANDRGEFPIVFSGDAGAAVTIRGEVTGRSGRDTVVLVGAHPSGAVFEGAADAFAVDVPTGQSVDLVVFEYVNLMSTPTAVVNEVTAARVVQVEPSDADVRVDVDLRVDPAATWAWSRELALPEDDFFGTARAYAGVYAGDSGWRVPYGIVTRGVVRSRRADLAGVVADVPLADPWTRLIVGQPTSDAYAMVTWPGFPEEGDLEDLRVPAPPSTAARWDPSSPLEVALAADERAADDLRLGVLGGSAARGVVWAWSAPLGDTIALPALPDGLDWVELAGPGPKFQAYLDPTRAQPSGVVRRAYGEVGALD